MKPAFKAANLLVGAGFVGTAGLLLVGDVDRTSSSALPPDVVLLMAIGVDADSTGCS